MYKLKSIIPTEYELQLQVCKFLSHALDSSTFWAHIPNGGYRHATEAKRLKAMGVTSGVPDIFLVHDGRVTFLELKRAKGSYLSPAQAHCHKRLEAAGSPVSVCRSLEDIEAALVRAGIPIRARTV